MTIDPFGIFNAAATAAKTLRDTALKIGGKIDQEARNELNGQIGDLLDRMQAMREAYSALLDRYSAIEKRNAELDRENAELRAFEADAKNYSLQQLGPDAFAYVSNAAGQPQQPAPCYCARCFGDKKKSLLQFEKAELHAHILACHVCGSRVRKTVDDGDAVIFDRRPRGMW
ncbi:hypothetical protein HNR60_001502 [Rhodopseudomonas rhenobacensis]|uniref:Uncharacterized protein n=1 Tax=Rhodopseudomonas rhenobacensis TaxID=87461 RepID=A0A7W7Z2J9_9BRAD|nr:hypothetical protein [Rhodopseudomonas rhenobacensis]MBB5046754.1 hypothetical protein [Rhodopseudomonas rhenobacensis]